jgi:hypothetical protein
VHGKLLASDPDRRYYDPYGNPVGTSDISDQIEALYTRVRPITDTLKELRAESCKVILRIILYLSSRDQQGAGFAINDRLLQWMVEVGVAFVDVEQYILE